MAIYILLGPPGSGKGTQAKVMSERLGLPHISMGDILREEIRDKSPLGVRIEMILAEGKLVPDEVTIEVAKQRVSRPDCEKGFIFDGFPRTIVQAERLDDILADLGREVDSVLYFFLDKDVVVERLSLRRSCKNCGAVYHLKYKKPKTEGKCDSCGGDLYLRRDDEEKVIENRFDVYLEQTSPLIGYYREKGLLYQVDASKPIDDISLGIFKALKE